MPRKRNGNPIITVKEITNLRPGDIVVKNGVSERDKSCISSMLGYVKDMCRPKYVSGYTYVYDKIKQVCHIMALGYGVTKKEFRHSLQNENKE